jgi:hypothetical protein
MAPLAGERPGLPVVQDTSGDMLMDVDDGGETETTLFKFVSDIPNHTRYPGSC